ncbi:MAG: NAD(P)H-binding protein [Chloroflexi bacterium]|nr:NAD(P)H-binding protein [Chloroflexota bacterium]
MARILVTGGTGALGSALVNQLRTTHHHIRLFSRKSSPTTIDAEWAQGDVLSGDGLAEALNGISIVANCVGDARNAYETDVLGVKRLAEASVKAGVQHFFHISIAGIDLIDSEFYKYKVSAEAAVINSGVAYSILRVTQFHSLLDFALSLMKTTPDGYVLPVAHDAQFQLIDTRDVAAYMLPLLTQAPTGRLPDLGGPEILRVEEITRTYLAARGIMNSVLVDGPQVFFGPVAVNGFQQGLNLVPNNRYGKITWADFVHEKYGKH